MKSRKYTLWLLIISVLVMGSAQILRAQAIGASGELKWLRVNSLHTYFSEQGAEGETGGTERDKDGTFICFLSRALYVQHKRPTQPDR